MNNSKVLSVILLELCAGLAQQAQSGTYNSNQLFPTSLVMRCTEP